MVLKQIIRDLRKEWSWAVFYTVVATMIAMAILYLSVSFSSVQRQSAAIRSFIDRNVIMFQLKTVPVQPNKDAAYPQVRALKLLLTLWITCKAAYPRKERRAASYL